MDDNIHAILVGAESYGDGTVQETRWNLNGPASDVEKLTRWLLAIGVPREQLYLHVSPLAENAARWSHFLGEVAIQARDLGGATSDAIRRTVEDVLTGAIDADSPCEDATNVLLLYWSGHGAIKDYARDFEQRVVFTADQRPDRRSVISVTNLVNSLRRRFKDFRLVLIVDACALDLAKLDLEHSLLVHGFAGGEMRPGKCEPSYLFYSAAAGQLAINRGSSAAGLFSEHLLDALYRSPDGGRDFCHDLHAAVIDAGNRVHVEAKGRQRSLIQSLQSWEMEKPERLEVASRSGDLLNDAAYYLCDRVSQWEGFRAIVKSHFKNKPRNPLFVLAHGREEEHPLSLLSRLTWELRLETELLDRPGIVIEHSQLSLSMGARPSQEEVHIKLRKVLRQRFNMPEATDQQLADHIVTTRQCHLLLTVIQSHSVRAHPEPFLTALQNIAEVFPKVDAPGALIFVVFISYPCRAEACTSRLIRGMERLCTLLRNADGRLRRRLCELEDARRQPDKLGCIAELGPVNADHLDDWMRLAYAHVVDPPDRDLLLQEVLRGQQERPMSSVVVELRRLFLLSRPS
jgi:hypothetical protein